MRINRRKPEGLALWMALWDSPKTQKSPANPKSCELKTIDFIGYLVAGAGFEPATFRL